MPKKTKKQKLLADIHKKMSLSVSSKPEELRSNSNFVKSQNINSSTSYAPDYQTDFKYQNNPAVEAKTIKIDSSYAYVKNDLIRITIFTMIALLLQGVLYFLLRTR